MSQGPHDPFLASTAAVARSPVQGSIEWVAFVRSAETILATLVALVELLLLAIYQNKLAWLPVVGIGAIIYARHQKLAWLAVIALLVAGAAGIFRFAPITTSIGFAYPAIFAGVIALAQGGRLWAALIMAVVISVTATFVLDVFQTQVSYPGKKVIVVAAMWATGEGKQPIFEDMVNQFEKEFPEYKVVVRWDGRWVLSKNRPRLLTQKDVPDLIEGSKEEMDILVKEKYALPLDDYMNQVSPETGKPWKDDWKPSLFALGRYHLDPEPVAGTDTFAPHPLDGKLVMVSGIYYDFVFFYNKAVAKKLGIEKMPQTWDEFKGVCDKARAAGIDPIMLDSGFESTLLGDSLLQANIPESQLRTTILGGPDRTPFTDPMYMRLFQLEREVADKYFMRGWPASPYPKAQGQFAIGNGLFLFCGTWVPGELKKVALDDKSKFDLGVIPFPHFADKPPANVIQDSGWIVLKDGKEREGTIRFLQFLSNHWGKEISMIDGNPVAFARDPIPPALEGISKELTEMKNVASDPMADFAPNWAQSAKAQLEDDFMEAKPGESGYMTAEEYAQKLEAKTLDYIKDGGEKVAVNPEMSQVKYAPAKASSATLLAPTEGIVGERRGTLGGWLGFSGLMLLPALLMMGVFLVFPAVAAFKVALENWSGFAPHGRYIGWANFDKLFSTIAHLRSLKTIGISDLFSDEVFYDSLKNSVIWMIVGGVGHFLFAIILATGLQDPKLRGKKFFQTMIIFPMFISAIGIAMLWRSLYEPKLGMINLFLSIFGLADRAAGTPGWLNPGNGIYPLLLVSIWGGVGGQVILLLAGLRQIPDSLYEAARIDGATEWQCFWRISLPLMRDILKIAVVLWVIGSLQVFGIVQGMLGPQVEPKLHVVSTYMFQTAFSNRTNIYLMGEATAMAVVLVAVTMVVVLILLGIYRLAFGNERLEL